MKLKIEMPIKELSFKEMFKNEKNDSVVFQITGEVDDPTIMYGDFMFLNTKNLLKDLAEKINNKIGSIHNLGDNNSFILFKDKYNFMDSETKPNLTYEWDFEGNPNHFKVDSYKQEPLKFWKFFGSNILDYITAETYDITFEVPIISIDFNDEQNYINHFSNYSPLNDFDKIVFRFKKTNNLTVTAYYVNENYYETKPFYVGDEKLRYDLTKWIQEGFCNVYNHHSDSQMPIDFGSIIENIRSKSNKSTFNLKIKLSKNFLDEKNIDVSDMTLHLSGQWNLLNTTFTNFTLKYSENNENMEFNLYKYQTQILHKLNEWIKSGVAKIVESDGFGFDNEMNIEEYLEDYINHKWYLDFGYKVKPSKDVSLDEFISLINELEKYTQVNPASIDRVNLEYMFTNITKLASTNVYNAALFGFYYINNVRPFIKNNNLFAVIFLFWIFRVNNLLENSDGEFILKPEILDVMSFIASETDDFVNFKALTFKLIAVD